MALGVCLYFNSREWLVIVILKGLVVPRLNKTDFSKQ